MKLFLRRRETRGSHGGKSRYNPYLLAPDHARQEKFFRDEMRARCIILNTRKQTIQQTYETILKRLDE